ncbi:15898_t:CDS:2 [Cetraspora pellucida]|uniref:15898_t:CDS:1 n=1 Tax=Cetraspora pellucida TaxID=1433469 RepID=A0A9N9FB16_9GLOM|nr:15898_t:CDS:2 [Cetraspora pellucida]
MPPQKKRNNITVACTNCRKRHVKCNKSSGEDKCTNCNKRNLDCTLIEGNKRGPKSTANAYQNTFMNNSSFIHDEHTSNNDQNIMSFLNFSPDSFSASDFLSHLYSHTTETIDATETVDATEATETIEIFQNAQPSLYFHDHEQIMPTNDQNISSFSTNDLNGSFYHETPHPHIDPLDEATESSQNCKLFSTNFQFFFIRYTNGCRKAKTWNSQTGVAKRKPGIHKRVSQKAKTWNS